MVGPWSLLVPVNFPLRSLEKSPPVNNVISQKDPVKKQQPGLCWVLWECDLLTWPAPPFVLMAPGDSAQGLGFISTPPTPIAPSQVQAD